MSGLNKHAAYDSMSTKALEELLRRDFLNANDEPLDMDAVLYITQILADRDAESLTGRLGDAETSWQTFRQNFIAPDSLCPGGDTNTLHTQTKHPRTQTPPSLRTLKTVLIAAVAAALLIGAAWAAGVLGWLPTWSGDYFSYSLTGENAAAPTEEYSSLEQALRLHNAPSNLVPTHFPAGYEPVGINHSYLPGAYITFGCTYSNGTGTIVLSYCVAYIDNFSLFAKDEGTADVYTSGGIQHYIMTNEEDYQAVWQNENFECCLSGFESREDLIRTIDSMY